MLSLCVFIQYCHERFSQFWLSEDRAQNATFIRKYSVFCSLQSGLVVFSFVSALSVFSLSSSAAPPHQVTVVEASSLEMGAEIGMIVGAVLVTIVALVILCIIVDRYCFKNRRNENRRNEDEERNPEAAVAVEHRRRTESQISTATGTTETLVSPGNDTRQLRSNSTYENTDIPKDSSESPELTAPAAQDDDTSSKESDGQNPAPAPAPSPNSNSASTATTTENCLGSTPEATSPKASPKDSPDLSLPPRSKKPVPKPRSKSTGASLTPPPVYHNVNFILKTHTVTLDTTTDGILKTVIKDGPPVLHPENVRPPPAARPDVTWEEEQTGRLRGKSAVPIAERETHEVTLPMASNTERRRNIPDSDMTDNTAYVTLDKAHFNLVRCDSQTRPVPVTEDEEEDDYRLPLM